MKEFRVISPVKIFTGKIGLRDEQAIPRRECLMANDQQGIYKIIKPIEFKAGEIIMLDDIDKATGANIAEVGGTVAADDVAQVIIKKTVKTRKTK